MALMSGKQCMQNDGSHMNGGYLIIIWTHASSSSSWVTRNDGQIREERKV